MKLRKITKDAEDHELECPHCGETQIVNDGTGNYECTDCGGDIEITLACPECGEELEVEEWGETECPYRGCGASFDSWKEAELTPTEDEAEEDAEDHEVECPHCGETQIVNDGTGNYECTDCGGDIEITLACPECGEELEVEEWGETECPYRGCGASFDSWKEAELTPTEDEAEEDAEDHEVECPHCGETQIVNDGTGNYECTDCGGDIEITLACPECGEELEVEEWGETECPYRGCGASFDSWKEAELTPAEGEVEEDAEDHEVAGEDKRTGRGLLQRLLDIFGPERPSSAVNEFIGKYRPVKLLGEGAFGQTWKAVDLITDETVALKLYKNATSSGALSELQKEVQNMRGIQHPHLVAYKDSNIIGSVYYLATEFCSRGSLANVGRLPTETAIRYIHQILDGVGHLHAMGFLHRDIKPDNIFLDQDGQIKIGDFGISIDAEHTIVGEYAGTPVYMAPEQFIGRTSRRSDIWSIGVVAYELLHGTRPFSSPEGIIQGHKPRIAIRDRHLAAILTKALDRNEKRRFQTCIEFKNAFE